MKKLCETCQYGRDTTNPFDKIVHNMLWCSNSKSPAFKMCVGDKFSCGKYSKRGKRAPLWMLAAAVILKGIKRLLR